MNKTIRSFGIVLATLIGSQATAATVNISASITPQLNASLSALDSPVTVAEGDRVNLNYSIANGATARFDVLDSLGAFYVWVRKPEAGPFTISDITLTLRDFATDGSGTGKVTKASEFNNGPAHLGPTFNYSSFGILAGDYFEFSGIDVGFKVENLFGLSPFTTTHSQSWTIFKDADISILPAPSSLSGQSSPSAVPLPAGFLLLLTAFGSIGFAARRGKAG